jgi:hypothetical protein
MAASAAQCLEGYALERRGHITLGRKLGQALDQAARQAHGPRSRMVEVDPLEACGLAKFDGLYEHALPLFDLGDRLFGL